MKKNEGMNLIIHISLLSTMSNLIKEERTVFLRVKIVLCFALHPPSNLMMYSLWMAVSID